MKLVRTLLFSILALAAALILAFVVVVGMAFSQEGKRSNGLPWRSLTSDGHWSVSKEVIPTQLRQQGALVAQFSHGFVDIETLGLFILSEDNAQSLLATLAGWSLGGKLPSEDYAYVEQSLCTGSESADGNWSIDRTRLEDWFKFCATQQEFERVMWKWESSDCGVGNCYVDVIHYLGTDFFSVLHGMY